MFRPAFLPQLKRVFRLLFKSLPCTFLGLRSPRSFLKATLVADSFCLDLDNDKESQNGFTPRQYATVVAGFGETVPSSAP